MKSDRDKKSMYELCDLCRVKRLQNKFTQLDVALRVGCTQQTISFFESGKIDSLSIFLIYQQLFEVL